MSSISPSANEDQCGLAELPRSHPRRRRRFHRRPRHFAAKALLPETLVLETAKETVELLHQYWSSEKKNLPLSNQTIKTIEAHLKTIPLA